ncbi:MAG: hypothetical protein JNK82_06775 [Myxococcaceae bacterium]|nr:hypothetical protein [Myxococcaceae bacterium]
MTDTTASAPPAAPSPAPSPLQAAVKLWFQAYRVEVILFAVSFVVLAGFSSMRFLRQSAAPHFVYQSKAWLEGRLDLDPQVLPNYEDWACVREVNGKKVRCEGQVQPTDRWYVSFPSFPAVVMLPFVALHGYQFNDTSFSVIFGALAIALFYSWLRQLSQREGSGRSDNDNLVLAATLGFGTVFFYCALRGEVWFTAEVMGVAFTCLYARNAMGAHRPVLAGLFFSMAVLTRTPLLFSGVFFVLEAVCPTPGRRLADLKAFSPDARKKLLHFAAGAAPLAAWHAWYNAVRFGSVASFGHEFFYNNRVNADIDRWGLFHPTYLARNVDAALVTLPEFANGVLTYSPWGMSLLLTLPLLVFVFISPEKKGLLQQSAGAAALVLVLSKLFPEERPPPGEFPIGHRSMIVWLAVVGLVGVWWVGFSKDEKPSRLKVPLIVTALCCAVPGLFYQNTGYAQFGFRFSVDWAPYFIAAFAVSAWPLKNRAVQAALALGFIMAFWGAIGFRGYTEGMRGW